MKGKHWSILIGVVLVMFGAIVITYELRDDECFGVYNN